MKVKNGGRFFILFLAVYQGCTTSSTSPESPQEVERVADKIFITDLAGQSWDVTHAVKTYNFIARDFQYGLGKHAIPPLIFPDFLLPGSPNYPRDDDDFLVLGVSLNGEARAYPLFEMSFHEVSNETFGETHVAPAY